MPDFDPFIDEANTALSEDGYHDVRRLPDGMIEMRDDHANVEITFSKEITVYDLVGVSMRLSEVAQEAYQKGETELVKKIRREISLLKKKHGQRLTAAHIESIIEDYEQWDADREAEDAYLAEQEE